MRSQAPTPEAYLAELPAARQEVMQQLRDVLREALPAGFVEVMQGGAIAYVVPHTLYPPGYHCDPKQPLPFMGLASQKHHISLDHLGLTVGGLLDWFTTRWEACSSQKLDMGKGCVRFKQAADIPWDLIRELAARMTPEEWIATYEAARQR